MQSDIYMSTADLIVDARQQLNFIRSNPIPDLNLSSPARLAFDPCIGGRLKTFVPLRIISVPPLEKTWEAIDALLDGWKELSLLANTHNLSTWEVDDVSAMSPPYLNVFPQIVGNSRALLPYRPPQIPYLRSYAQVSSACSLLGRLISHAVCFFRRVPYFK